jgi:hypothetical protein
MSDLTTTASAGRFFDGTSWTDVEEDVGILFRGTKRPAPPMMDGDGTVHVAIASFRGAYVLFWDCCVC